MEQSYVEATTKIKTTISVVATKVVCILVVLCLLFMAVTLGGVIRSVSTLLGLAGAVFLFWYWPRFKREWEYIFCDGQLDFDVVEGGEKRKHRFRIDIEEADIVAPMGSHYFDGYRNLKVRDYSSLEDQRDKYGIVTKVSDSGDKVLIVFEPSERMVEVVHTKAPNVVKLD